MTKGFTNKVYKHRGLSATQADILKACSQFLTINDMVKSRKTSRNAVYKTIKILLAKGLIERSSRGIYGLTEAGKKGLHSFIGLRYNLRQHNFAIKVKVLESPKNWDKRRSQILTMPYFNKRVQLKNNYYDLLSFGKIQLKVTSQSVIFRLPTIYAPNIDEAIIQTMETLYNAIPKVENLFKIKLIKDYKGNITIISQEYARLNDSLAKIYKKEDNKLYITDEEGKIWLIADYSLSTNELEAISPNKADEDMRIVHAFLNDLRKNPTTFTEMTKDVDQEFLEMMERIRNMSTAQLSQTQVMEQMNNNLLRLNIEFAKFKRSKGDNNI